MAALECSARFNDLQHVHPKDLIHTSNTVELKAWQTKTVSAAQINHNPVPLIAPKYSFTGIPWWTSWVASVRRLVSEEAHGLLAPDGKQGLCRADSTAVHTRKGSEMAQRCYSPPGCHPEVAEAAVVALVPGLPDGDLPERRMYLGNWLTESTADVYVREKRNVVVEIWGQVAQKVPNLNLGPGRERREDLNHPDWADPLPPPAVDITDAGPEGREDQIEREGEASPSVLSGSAPSARSWSVVEHEPGDTPVKAKDLFPATPDLPLRVVAAVKRTGNAGQSRIHLLNVEGTAVGCGWRPAASKVQKLSVLDYMTEQEAYGKCERCFKRHGFPADWALEPAEVPTLQEDFNSSADSGSETDDSVDTQSETEVVALPLVA